MKKVNLKADSIDLQEVCTNKGSKSTENAKLNNPLR